MSTAVIDVIDHVVGIEPGDRLDLIRRSRPVARDQIQRADEALFGSPDEGSGATGLRLADRWLVGAFVAELTTPGSALAHHRRSGLDRAIVPVLDDLLAHAPGTGPAGTYREPGLAAESRPVETWRVPEPLRERLGAALAVVVEHAHLLVTHPRDSRPEVLQRLVDAGWSRPQIVAWSQLVSFVSFQARIAHGLTHLKAAPAQEVVA